MGKACNIHRSDTTCIQNFSKETEREETTWKTQPQIGSH